MKEGMSKKGYDQGNMSPTVSDYQKPASNFAESQFGTTTDYINRQDSFVNKGASDLRKQAYKGRYN